MEPISYSFYDRKLQLRNGKYANFYSLQLVAPSGYKIGQRRFIIRSLLHNMSLADNTCRLKMLLKLRTKNPFPDDTNSDEIT